MFQKKTRISLLVLGLIFMGLKTYAQKPDWVKVEKSSHENSIKISIAGKVFTQFLYPDSLEKPVLFPIYNSSGNLVTRGFPLIKQEGDPTDHPHHIGLWFTFENINGLDFWNNSYAIPPDKKNHYGWIRTDTILKMQSGRRGILEYHALWTNQNHEALLEETTRFIFSGMGNERKIDRITELKAVQNVLFKDAKDGLLGIRMAHALQIPSLEDQKYTDSKGNETLIKGGMDTIAGGNYLTSEGKTGNDAWSTRARWCKAFGKIGRDSTCIVIMDHPKNLNYPTFWHARGYGLFAANPLGEKIFTQGKSEKNYSLKKGESMTFRYSVIIQNGKHTLNPKEIDLLAKEEIP